MSHASTIDFTLVAGGLSPSQNAYAIDPTTGEIYERVGFSSGLITRYSNLADFVSGTNPIVYILPFTSPAYFAVTNGDIYTQDGGGSTVKKFSTAFQTIEGSASNPGTSFQNTFNWGGNTIANWMQDVSGLYVFGKNIKAISTSAGWIRTP